MQDVLNNFIQYNDGAYNYEFKYSQRNGDIKINHYKLFSQKWPIIQEPSIPSTIWTHNLIIFVPKVVKYQQVLLYVNGGYNINATGGENWDVPKEDLDYSKIAQDNMALVVNLQNVPNQYLLINNTYKKEDQILAYTYKLFMDNPESNIYLPGHLPMAKSIIKAMDAVEEIVKFPIDSFILSGASKRGSAVWLAAIEDSRVSAIVPIVIDILNVQKTLNHICSVYEEGCPFALRDYIEEGIPERTNSPQFAKLTKIEDPASYLNEAYDPKYREQIAKLDIYIMNASGDDFFTPDCSKFYFPSLPGDNNYIRYLPNALHYLAGNFISDSTGNLQKVEDALSNFLYFQLNNVTLPSIEYSFHQGYLNISSNILPQSATLWSYNNEQARDFRFLSSYSKPHLLYKQIVSYLGLDLCDRCYEANHINFDQSSIHDYLIIKLPSFEKGWQASFLELNYNLDKHDFVITTEVNVVGQLQKDLLHQEF